MDRDRIYMGRKVREKYGGLMVNALDSSFIHNLLCIMPWKSPTGGVGFEHWPGRSAVFLGKTLAIILPLST